MPVYEFECRDCMTSCNKGIDALVKNLDKTHATKLIKSNSNFLYIEVLNPKNDKKYSQLEKKAKRELEGLGIRLMIKSFSMSN